MKKSRLFKKSILILSLILFLGLFAGCLIIIPDTGQTGTVYINITNSDWYYDIYLDSYSNYLGTTNVYGQEAFYNVPTGYRTFYAEDVDGYYSGQKTQSIHTGSNSVNIQVY
ncbi:MAG: hypothetical protein MUO60_09970 [Clostridiaceae bacterium]|nr:hypothetical protein [Clostridiaceae bacterium]